MKPVRSAASILLSAAAALLINGSLASGQDRGRGGNQGAPPTLRGKVVAYEADQSITVETKAARGGEAKKTEFTLVKDKTKIELVAGVKGIEVGVTVSVWTDKDDPKTAAKVVVQGAAAPGRGRGGAGAAPADKGDDARPAPPAPKAEDSVNVKKASDGSAANGGKIEPRDLGKLLGLIKPAGEHEVAWREIPWMTDVAKARQKAADEGKMLVHWSMAYHALGMS